MSELVTANALLSKPAQELRETWQCRALALAKGKTYAVLQAIIAHEFPVIMPIMLRVVFPEFKDIQRPFICSYATINKAGTVCAEMVDRDGHRKIVGLYKTEDALRSDFRRLADRLKLDDADRLQMFGVLRKWVVADLRVDHNGNKVVH